MILHKNDANELKISEKKQSNGSIRIEVETLKDRGLKFPYYLDEILTLNK